MNKPCFLVLADGTVLKGTTFGAEPVSPGALGSEQQKGSGEIVFNTGMTGYHEILTDPSYTGQIVTMTYPHIGNYGSDDSWSEIAREGKRELPRVKASGLVVRAYYEGPVPKERMTLHNFLAAHGVPGISEVDTRALTLRLRDKGSVNGVIVRNADWGGDLTSEELDTVLEYLKGLPEMEGLNLVEQVGTDLGYEETGTQGLTFALVDCGIKENILRELRKRNVTVKVFPATTTAKEILSAGIDGVLISNGPGDPAVLTEQIGLVKDLIGKAPIFGICLGHQLISLALGARTYKMKFGHHGVNHPVRDEVTKKVFVTSQNHGFAVDPESIPESVRVWFRNANDKTIEGIAADELHLRTAQFHPESAPGPHDSSWIFDSFLETAVSAKQK